MMLLFSPCKRCPCPCCDAVLRSCEEALAGIILHRPPSLWFAWVRSGCAGPPLLPREPGAGTGRGGGIPWGGRGGGGGGTESIYTSSDDPMLDAQTSGTWPSAHACLCRCMASFYLRHRQLRCVIIGTLAASATTPIAGQLLLHPGSHPQHNRR